MKPNQVLSLLLCGALAFPQSLSAQGKRGPTVLVGGIALPEGDEPARSAVESAVGAAFEEEGRLTVVPAEAVAKWKSREERAGAPPSEDLREARDLLAEGTKAYRRLEFKRALKLLSDARREFILKLPALRSNRDLIDTHLFLGVTHIALKDAKSGVEEFRRVVYLDPKKELSAKDFPPSVLESFAKARQSVMAEDPIRLRILSEPAAAEVFLNGRRIGTTPMETRLQPGEYFLLVRKSGTSPWYKPVSIAKRVEEVRAVLEPDGDVRKWGRLFRVREGADRQSADLGKIGEIAGSLGADLVFLGKVERLREYRLLGQLYDSRTSELSKVAMVTAGGDIDSVVSAMPDLAEALVGFLGTDGRILSEDRPDLAVPPEGMTVGQEGRPQVPMIGVTPPAAKAWYQRWWVYPLILGLGAGIYFGAKELGGRGGSQIVIDNRGNI